MRYVLDQIKEEEQRILLAIVRMEIDYELLSLHDALEAKNVQESVVIKARLLDLVERLKYLMQYV